MYLIRCKLSILQILVILLWCLAVYDDIFICIIPYMGYTAIGITHILITITLLMLLIVSYMRACYMNPGVLKNDDNENNNNNNNKSIEMVIKPKNMKPDEALRNRLQPKNKGWCKMCKCIKPPRCHHCRMCQRCVLKMDHHCPWVNNCVGYRNYKSFVLFLVYTAISSFYSDYLVYIRIRRSKIKFEGIELILLWTLVFIGSFTGLMVTALLNYHLRLISINSTTIEWQERYFAQWHYIKPVQLPNYDLGLYRNIEEVFGKNILLWALPTTPHGNGKHFVMKNDPTSDTEYNSGSDADIEVDSDDDSDDNVQVIKGVEIV